MDDVFQVFFWCFVEGGVDCLVCFGSDAVGDLKAEGLAGLDKALDVEVPFVKGDIGAVAGGEGDVVGGGDVAFD